MRTMTRKALLETIAASGANLKTDSTNGISYLCEDNTANPIVNYLPGWPTGKVKAVRTQSAVLEVTKVHIIGREAETIEGGKRYKVMIGSNTENKETAAKGFTPYGYIAPLPTTSPNSAALAQVYGALASKINADTANNYGVAYAATKLVVGGVSALTSGIAVGDTIFQGSTLSGATYTGKVAFVDSSWGAATGQVIWVYAETGTFDVTAATVLKKGTGSGTAITDTSTAKTRTAGQALIFIDNTGYFPAQPKTRQGESALYIEGFTTATAEISRAAVYSQGVGSDMLKQVPVFMITNPEVIAGNADGSGVGDANMQLNANPVSGSYYTTVQVEVENNPSDNVLHGGGWVDKLVYTIFLKQTSATSRGTNCDDLITALSALVG